MKVEVSAIQMALRVSIEKSWQNITIETDSRTLLNIILGKWKCPWDIVEVIEEIDNNVKLLNAKIQHIIREGN